MRAIFSGRVSGAEGEIGLRAFRSCQRRRTRGRDVTGTTAYTTRAARAARR